MFIGLIAGLVTAWKMDVFNDQLAPGAESIGMLLAAFIILLVGLIDDIRDISPPAKVAGMVLAGSVLSFAGIGIVVFRVPFLGVTPLTPDLSALITVLWVVGMANAINLIDGLDGLAAGVTAIAATSLLILAAQQNRFDAAMLAAAVIGACLGFLRYNFNPASIFMGDSGALFLGFTLACISLMGAMKSVAAIALAVPLIIIGIPIFDTASAIIRRIRHKRPIQEADRGHIHHRLLGRGFDQRQTVLIIYVWCIALGLGAYAIRYAPGAVRLLALVSLFAVTGGMAYWLGLFEAAHHHDEDEDAESVTHSTGA
jgi:UDP-GlcNAc:undecaprenyl-phosphate GlcNAc-1-phosphate transferase